MKKIRQGRQRRRDRQLEATERQLNSTKLSLRFTPNLSAGTKERLEDRQKREEDRLRALRAGNYPT
jgi:DNA-nicking Smr family endonuclease